MPYAAKPRLPSQAFSGSTGPSADSIAAPRHAIGSAAAVFLVLSLLFLSLVFCGGCVQRNTAELDLLSLLPGTPNYLIYARCSEITTAPLWEEYRTGEAKLPAHYEEFRQFLVRAGIDVDRDLDTLVMGFFAAEADAGSFGAVLTGRFEPDNLNTALTGLGFTEETYREILLLRPSLNAAEEALATPLSGWNLIVYDESALGFTDSISSAMVMIDRRLDGGPSLSDHEVLSPLLQNVDHSAAIWGIGLIPPGAAQGVSDNLPIASLPEFRNMSFSLRIGPVLNLLMQTRFPDEDTATKMAGQLNGWIQLGKGFLKANPRMLERFGEEGDTANRLQEAIDGIFISADGQTVKLAMMIPEDLLNMIWRQGTAAESSTETEPERSTE